VTTYPEVRSESDTLDAVLAGASLARFGDGELKMIEGASLKSQSHHPMLAARLRAILQDSGNCLVGIPNIHAVIRQSVNRQKAEHWGRHVVYARLLATRTYVSAFVTRPDSAPWIDVPDYWSRVEALWHGRDVTVVRGSGKSFTADDLTGAGTVTEILAPRQHAWKDYDSILERIGTPERVLIGLGPTATVLAVELCARGVQAIDLGHLGMFWRKHLRGDPLVVTEWDKLVLQ
jgi:hypothetical protein